MKLSFAFFATAGEFSPDGRMNVFGGGINHLVASDFPAAMPSLTLLAQISLEPQECEKEHALLVEFLKPSGEALFNPHTQTFKGPLNALDPNRHGFAGIALTLQGIVFFGPGTYTVRLSADGVKIGSIILDVVKSPESSNKVSQTKKQGDG